ncbi:hypothetical protein JTB14_009136 [Gonioctena quinquepunctata]|nr:hypothetical protein JTB14_009136 [Gonioctena quinquepunctata]
MPSLGGFQVVVYSLRNGQACPNAVSYPHDLDEESEYVLEVLEASESNITDNEDDDDEFDVQVERPEEENDDELEYQAAC